MKKSGLFNSAQGTTDRAYQAIDFALPFGALAGGKGGIVMGVGDSFEVKWTAGGSFTLGSGFAFLGEMPGWWYYSDEEMALTPDNASTPSEPCFALSTVTGQERVNILAVKMDAETDRAAELVVLAGNLEEGVYETPTIDNTDGYDVYYVPIAEVKTNTTTITEVTDKRVSISGQNCLSVAKDDSGNPKVRAGYCGIQQLKDEDTDNNLLADKFKGEWKESYYGIGISDGKQLITQGLCHIQDATTFPDGLEWPVTYYVQDDGKIGLNPTQKVAGYTLSESMLLVNLQGPFGQNDKYEGEMIGFTAMPGEGSDVRFKIHLPDDANGVELRYQMQAWTAQDDDTDGVLIANLRRGRDNVDYYGDNVWFVTPIYDVYDESDPQAIKNELNAGTVIYVKAFPYASSTNINAGVDANELKVTVGTLLHEWTMDESMGTPTAGTYELLGYNTISDPSGKIGSTLMNSANATDAYATVSNNISLGGKTLTFFLKTQGEQTGLFGHSAVYHLGGCVEPSGVISIGARDASTGNYTAYAISSDSYHSIAITVNNREVKLYVDGVHVASTTVTTSVSLDIDTIGRHRAGTVSVASNYFMRSRMDQIRIFNCQLTPDDIKNIHNGGAGC